MAMRSNQTPVRRVYPYKDFLQPALHRRFSSTALVLLAIAYAESLFLSSWSSWLWAWFPFSGAGFRALCIFFCGLIIIVLRIAQFHIGIRTSHSPFATFLYNVAKPKTVETVVSYCLAGWLFAHVYRWSADDDAGLAWIVHYTDDRTRLNERALFLVVHVVLVGAVNAALHLFWDSDRLLLGTARSASSSTGKADLFRKLAAQLPLLVLSSVTRSLVGVFVSVFVYAALLRAPAWRLTLACFRPFYTLPKSTAPPLMKPYFSTWSFLPTCFLAGLLLTLLLVIGNAAFSLFLVTEPIKNGRPLTADAKDPNGSLLNGLRSKRDRVRAFALWELAYIARDCPDRRTGIYTDIDRKDGSTWSQIYQACLAVVRTLENRIDPPVATTTTTNTTTNTSTTATSTSALAVKPVRTDDVVVSTPKKKSFAGDMASKVALDTQSPPRLSPFATKVLADAKQRLRDVQADMAGPSNPDSGLQSLVRQALALPVVGWPFQQRFRNRITAAVLGGPYGEPSVYVNAVNALTLLAVHSLQEDRYGNVQRDVAAIVRELTRVARKLEAFKAAYPLHWTDLEGARACPEVDAILDALKDGLTDLLNNFGQYSRDLRLTQADMRLAAEAATAGRDQDDDDVDDVEMREAR